MIGLAIDGTGAGHCRAKAKVCELCQTYCDEKGDVIGLKHELVVATVVGSARFETAVVRAPAEPRPLPTHLPLELDPDLPDQARDYRLTDVGGRVVRKLLA